MCLVGLRTVGLMTVGLGRVSMDGEHWRKRYCHSSGLPLFAPVQGRACVFMFDASRSNPGLFDVS